MSSVHRVEIREVGNVVEIRMKSITWAFCRCNLRDDILSAKWSTPQIRSCSVWRARFRKNFHRIPRMMNLLSTTLNLSTFTTTMCFFVSWVILFHKFLDHLIYMSFASIEAPNVCLFLLCGTSNEQREEWILGVRLGQMFGGESNLVKFSREVSCTFVPFNRWKCDESS